MSAAGAARGWRRGLAASALGHGAVLAAVLLLARGVTTPPEPPAMLIELPPLPPPAQAEAAVAEPAAAMPAAAPATPVASAPVFVPRMHAPAEAVTVPPKVAALAPMPAAVPQVASAPAAPPAAAAPARATASVAPAASIGDDPKARKAEANYYQLLMAYLARRKQYPAEAKAARQQGVVTVRFTIDRAGNVSGEGIRRGSGFAVLDEATVALVRRVSPVPPLPAAMGRDTVTVSLPIEYSLATR